MKKDLIELLNKYDVPVPRYTSYPTVPYWNKDQFTTDQWLETIKNRFVKEHNEISLYIHLPFCEELCTYCACNKRITKNHGTEAPYLAAVLKEWEMYLNVFPGKPIIREIHLGGGTPTFFSPEHLKQLIQGLVKNFEVVKDHEFSIEVHPNYTTFEHLEALRSVGFNRISLGVQDFNYDVQYIINRIQTFEETKRVIDQARQLGFESVNLDLIYGLPKQTLASIEHTIAQTKLLMPDRIAFYSYAHVPWKSKGQRRYSDADVPVAAEKIAMYSLGNAMLSEAGFKSIGMDHFALPSDKLVKSYDEGSLHRNFMGYTTTNNKLLIGLGTSSISDSWEGFAQNEKVVEAYEAKINAGDWAFVNGHILSAADINIRKLILDLMCQGKLVLDTTLFSEEHLLYIQKKWDEMVEDGLIFWKDSKLTVLPEGRLFIRNITSVIDQYLFKSDTSKQQFSKAL